MNCTVESASDSLRSSVSSPGMPNTYCTPSASRHSTNTSDALRSLTSATLSQRPSHYAEPMPGALLAIDAPYVLYRSFFALPDSITDADEHPVNALLGAVD